jgi:arylformamidase
VRDWIDISVPVRDGMAVWPGDPPTRIERIAAIERGDAFNLSAVSMWLHTGTHLDAPLHYLENAAAIGGLPLGAVIGPARVISIQDPKSITARELADHKIRRGERILFKTRNSERASFDDYVSMAPEAAGYLAGRGIRVAGIDYLSIGSADEDGDEVHRILLGAGVWIIEGLDLSAVDPGKYDLVCLPLNIPACEGAPARAILRRR